jgi:hypothetical protein
VGEHVRDPEGSNQEETTMASRISKKPGKKRTAEDGEKAAALGEYGQSMFESWRSQGHFSAHRSNPDKDAWDYFVEMYDPAAKRAPPFDEIATTLSCKVQVKTVSSDTGHCQIELSILKRMTDQASPWFVLILVSSEMKKIDRAYLLEIAGDRLAAIMKRLHTRKAGQPLNKAFVTLSWSDTDALDDPFAQSFVKKVKTAVGDQKDYIEKKSRFLAKVGYDKVRYKGSISIKAASAIELYEVMSEFAVGLRDSLDLTAYSMEEVRFGVSKPRREITEANEPKWSFKDGVPPGIKATIDISDAEESVSLPCDFYSTRAVFPFLPADHVRHRFLIGPLSLILLPTASVQLVFDGDPQKEWPAEQLGKVGKAIRLLQQKEVSLTVTLDGESQSPPLRIKEPAALPTDFTAALALCEVLSDLVHDAGQPGELTVTIQDIIDNQHELRFLAAAVNSRFKIENFRLGPQSVSTASEKAGKELDAFLCPYVTIAGRTIVPVIALEGVASVDPESGETLVERPHVKLLKMKTLRSGESGEEWWSKEQPTLKARDGAEIAYVIPPYA